MFNCNAFDELIPTTSATPVAPAASSPALTPAGGLSEAELVKRTGKLWADDDPEDDGTIS